jgi:hypothetical protein
MNKMKISVATGVLICGYISSAEAFEENMKPVKLSADDLISKDLTRSVNLKDLKHNYEVENLELMRSQVLKDMRQNAFEIDKINKTFSSNELIEKETKVKSKRLDLNYAEEEKRIEFLNKYPMSILGIEPQKKDLINNIAEAELEKAKSVSVTNSNSNKINRVLSTENKMFKDIYTNNMLISENLHKIDNYIENLGTADSFDLKNYGKIIKDSQNLSEGSLSKLDRIAFNKENPSIYGTEIIELRKILFKIKTKTDFIPILETKKQAKNLISNEINDIQNLLKESNSLLNIMFLKNHQNKTDTFSKNDGERQKSTNQKVKKIDILTKYKNMLKDLNSNKISLNEIKNKYEVKSNLNKEQTIKILKKQIKKIERERYSQMIKNKEKRKIEIEKLKLKAAEAKSLAEKKKIEAEIKEKILMEQKLKAEEINRLERERIQKQQQEKQEESELKDNYKIISYYNGVLTLKNKDETKSKIYKNTKIKNWTFVNWKSKEMEAVFEKDGRYITKRLKPTMDGVNLETEAIGKQIPSNTNGVKTNSTSVSSIPTTGTDALVKVN